MTAPDDSSELWGDYLSECDEHLSEARQTLLEMSTAPASVPGRDRVDALFRHFHTLKGLSGIAGVAAAERAAHVLEAYLVAARKGRIELGSEGIAVLIDGVAVIETVIANHPSTDEPPELAALVERVESFLTEDVGDPGEAEPPAVAARSSVSPPTATGTTVWRVSFTPTPELAARGVSVTSVRERLKAAGTVLRAEPGVLPGGGIRFTFFLSGPADLSAFVGWAEDGLTVDVEGGPAPSAPPPAVDLTPASVPPAAPRVGMALAPAHLVRVDLGRLDDLMQTVGELILSRARLETQLSAATRVLPTDLRRELEETGQVMARQLRQLRDEVMRARLVPVRDVFARMRLVAREAARTADKDVELVLSGEQTEVDKFVVERMAAPLLHLVRNAVSHGVEPPAVRLAAGKAARGRVDLRAAAAGGLITVQVEDDGRGIDPAAVFEKARRSGLAPPSGSLSDPAALLDVLCTPGFSTREAADRTSGRGVGLDVVRETVEDLGGSLELVNRPGTGSRFSLRLPVTLAIADVVTVAVGGQTFAVPQATVREVVRVEPRAISAVEQNELLEYHGGVVSLLRLGDVFGSARRAGPFDALILGEGAGVLAVGADRVIGLREAVIRPLTDPLVQVLGVAAATELGDGRAVLVLDTAALARYARSRTSPGNTPIRADAQAARISRASTAVPGAGE